MARVLVTRPEPGASRTAERLRALGHEPIVLPLTRIEALSPQWPSGPFDGVLATSANAFASTGSQPDPWRNLSLYVVGEQTARAAGSAGFERIRTVAADVDALLARLSGACARGSRFLYLCGRERRPDLEKGLEARAHIVTPVETYDTVSVSYLTDKIREIAGPDRVHAALVMSGVAADGLAVLTGNEEFSYLFDKTQFLCISRRVAEAFASLPQSRIQVAQTPDETALLQLVEAISDTAQG